MPLKRVLHFWPWAAAVLSGILLALCFAPWSFTGLVWVALIPLICAVWFGPGAASRQPFWLGYLAGLVFFPGAFHWLSALGDLFSQPLLYALPVLVGIVFGCYFGFWTWFLARILAPTVEARHFRKSTTNLLIGAIGAAAWITHEWVRGWFMSGGWGWNGLSVPLNSDLPLIQIAELTGALGLSWLVAYVNLMIVIVVRRIAGEIGSTFLKRIRWEFSISVAIVVAVFAYGVRALLAPAPPTFPLRVTAIQPNVSQFEKFSAANEDAIFEQVSSLTKLATATARPPDLLIWPESATPRGLYADEVNYRFVLEHAALGDFAFLMGSVEDDLATGRAYNVAKLFTERGQVQQTHRKMHLVPFGEFLPLRPLLEPIAGALVPGDFFPGDIATAFDLAQPKSRISALICFEDTLGNLTRAFVLNGAQLLVNITNDGWFLHTAGAEQHLQNAILRSVETRRPLIRCTNTGMTCAITRNGRVDRWLPPFQSGFATREIDIPQAATTTFYTRHGDWIAHLASILTALAVLVAYWAKHRRRAA